MFLSFSRYKRYLLKLAKEHEELEKKTKVEGYEMPVAIINEHDEKYDRKAQEAILKRVRGSLGVWC